MIRIGELKDFNDVNVIRKQVSELHVKGEPDIFKKGFTDELRDHLKEFIDTENKILLVLEEDDKVCAYAMIEFLTKPETPYMYGREFIKIHELGVLESCHNKGYGKQLINKVKEVAESKNINLIELDAWSFNENALGFYNKLGFETYREYLRLKIF